MWATFDCFLSLEWDRNLIIVAIEFGKRLINDSKGTVIKLKWKWREILGRLQLK